MKVKRMPNDMSCSQKLKSGTIGAAHIVFFVVAAAAPLTAVVGASPAAFSLGNGAGVPGTYLLVGLLYVAFSAGFAAMNRFVSSASGFYALVAQGLGKPSGLASALVSLATYNAIDIAVYGIFGFFADDMVRSVGGPHLPWIVYAAVLSLAVYFSGKRSLAFSGTLLAICMVAEILILAVLSVSILLSGGGPEGITTQSFVPNSVFAKGFGISLVFVVASFLGFEATAIFGEEARDAKRTVARATYVSVLLIAFFYAFVTWTITLYYGTANIAKAATDHAADLYLSAINARLSPAAGVMMRLLLITSLFACALSFHNTANRYLFSLGREGVLWRGFSRTHSVHYSPYVAGQAQTAFALGVSILLWLAGADPYAVVFAWMSTFASIGILVMQIMVCLAVLVFFSRDARDVDLYSRCIAPAVSLLGLSLCLILMVANLSLVSGSESWVVDTLPALVIALLVTGFILTAWMRQSRPLVYANLGRSLT
jgi:amino acid transporter